MPIIIWSAAHELGIPAMDRTHQEFVELYNGVAGAGDRDLAARFDALVDHTVAHFAQEDRWMVASGFPPTAIHRAEHDRLLEQMRVLQRRVAAGDTAAGRPIIDALPGWFDQHAATMDAALANWIRRTGYRAVAGDLEAASVART